MAGGKPSTSRWTGGLRRTRRVLGYSLAVAVIALAVVVGTASQLLPLLERHPDAVAAWLSDRTGQPIAFDSLQAQWTRRGPLLGLQGLRIGDADAPLRVDQARLLVSIYSGLVPGRPLTELRLGGVVLALSRDADGRWQVDGLGTAAQGEVDAQAALDALEGLGEIQVRDARLEVSIAEDDRRWSVPRVDLRLRASGGRIRAGLLGFGEDALVPLVVIAELDRRSGDGRIHLRADGADVPRWAGNVDVAGVTPMAGQVGLSAWVTLAGQRVVAVDGELRLAGLALAAGSTGSAGAPLEVESVQLGGRWHSEDGRWALRLPQARWRVDGTDYDLGGVWGQGEGERFALEVEHVEIEPWLRLLVLGDRVPPDVSRWLAQARPHGRMQQLQVGVDAGRLASGSAQLEGLGVAAANGVPGLAGVGGALRFDAAGALLEVDEAAWTFDWPDALAAPLVQRVDGQLAAWRHGAGWALGSGGLSIRGQDYGGDVRGEVRLEPDGGRPWLALALQLEPGPLAAAQRFWFRNVMPPPVVDWLERALLEGRVVEGHALVVGDLDDWPFRDGEGVFDSSVRIEDVELEFLEDWPHARSLSGTAGFTSRGMRLEAGGVFAGVPVATATGAIADWEQPVLELQASGESDAAALLELLQALPLDGPWRERAGTLEVSGPARAAVELRVPFRRDLGVTRVGGTADLRGVDVADPTLGLDFTDTSGRLRFGGAGFSADELSVRLDGHVGSLSLAVGDQTADAAQLVEASLRGRFGIAGLLARAEALQPLVGLASGEADFTVLLSVPDAGAGAAGATRLEIASDLVGVDLALPAPLRKRPRVALPLQVEVPLPIDAGELQVRLGGLLHFRGHLPVDGPFGGMLALGQPAEPARDPGRLDVVGQVAVLDVAGWAAVLREGLGDAAPGEGLRLGTVDVSAGQLNLLDRALIETRLRLARDADGMQLRIDGPELAGELVVPDRIERGLVGRFERLHWPSGRQASGGAVTVDPAGIPPLDFAVDDLRFGEARLGQARLLTYPTPEGMQVERLSAESDQMQMEAVGTWSQIEGRAYSRFSLNFVSANLGQMLSSLGYAGIVDGGPTQAELVAGWVGSPAGFSLDAVEGQLSVDVGAGRILEVDPGAGRLLGLVSLAELPRRLSLDFSDFFQQGFGFNTITGRFELGDGQARTDALVIDGPAALITVSGSTALQGQTYDQLIEVLPKTGGVLPVVGAITGGPAGAAIGAVAQAIFNQPFRMAARVLYRVTGDWRAPDVEVVERGPARAATVPDAAPGVAPDPG